MEKDIEILESFIKEVMPEYEKVKIGCEEYEIPILPIKFKPTKEIAQAIKNLINRVKELEEKQNRLAFKTNSLMNEVITNNIVSKDVIREEIKKLKDMNVEGEVFTTAVNFAIKELEELLNK